jgi:hypothetical protein
MAGTLATLPPSWLIDRFFTRPSSNRDITLRGRIITERIS